jgi:hypothetical protein
MFEESVQLFASVEHVVLGQVVSRPDRMDVLAPRQLIERL